MHTKDQCSANALHCPTRSVDKHTKRLAFATISNLINGESSIQLRVDELVSSLGLTIFTIIWNSANGGSSIQLLVDELARKVVSDYRRSICSFAALVSKPLRPMAPGTRAADESFITLTLELNDFHQSKPLQYFYLRPTALQALPIIIIPDALDILNDDAHVASLNQTLLDSLAVMSFNRCSIYIYAPQLIRRCCRCLRLSLAEPSPCEFDPL